MIIEKIKKDVFNQIFLNNIQSDQIDVLEKEWGFVVQVTDEYKKYYNVVYNREGEIIYPFGDFDWDSGSIYTTKIIEVENEKGEREKLPIRPEVCFRILDEHHFLIPRSACQQNVSNGGGRDTYSFMLIKKIMLAIKGLLMEKYLILF